jgi:magnesium and cobalt transporter
MRYPLSLVHSLIVVVDPSPSSGSEHAPAQNKKSFLRPLMSWLQRRPESHEALLDTLASAEENQLIGSESRGMLEGVLRLSGMTAGDAMVASARMDILNIDDAFDNLLNQVIDAGHSRFPVYEDTRDNIIGILLAKDLLKRQRSPEINLRALLRPVVYVPESKRLNDLLREFRANRNHLAIVIDEFGQVAGIITIEDVLEEIVGEIEDEFDTDEDEGDIFSLADRTWRVSGSTSIERINEAFNVSIPDHEFETIGGFIADDMGHVPRRGEQHELQGLRFTVMLSRGGVVRWFKVSPTSS